MPLNFRTSSGTVFISYSAAMIWFEMELCPQPAHNVLGAPRYSFFARPARFRLEGAPAMGRVSVMIVAPLYLRLDFVEVDFLTVFATFRDFAAAMAFDGLFLAFETFTCAFGALTFAEV